MRTSYSAIATYLQCPQKYKFQEIDKIRVPKSREAIFGTLIHSTLHFMFRSDPLFPTLDEVINYFQEHWPQREVFNKEAERDFQKNPWTEAEEKAYFEQGVLILKKYYERNAPWNYHVVDLESRFTITLMDEKTGTTHVLAGIMDRIDQRPDGRYEIIDYKTSKRMPPQASLNNDLQLSFYSLGLQARWPHIKPHDITLSLYFVKHGEKLSTEASADAAEQTKTKILAAIRSIETRIQSGKTFEPMPSALCNWCGYRPQCPAWKHLYRARETSPLKKDELEPVVAEYFAIKKAQKEREEKLKTLQEQIKAYMATAGVTRVFGDEGVIAKKTLSRYAYDLEKIKSLLVPLGKWEEILKADDAKIKKIMRELPEDIRGAVLDARRVVREYEILSASENKKTVSPTKTPHP